MQLILQEDSYNDFMARILSLTRNFQTFRPVMLLAEIELRMPAPLKSLDLDCPTLPPIFSQCRIRICNIWT
jgi:hypothetical protein